MFGLLIGLIGLFYRFVAISQKMAREKAMQQEHNRRPQAGIEEFDCPRCAERIRLELPPLRKGLATHAPTCPRCGEKAARRW